MTVRPRWTATETEALQVLYGAGDWSALSGAIPLHSKSQIIDKANRLGLQQRKPGRTPEEVREAKRAWMAEHRADPAARDRINARNRAAYAGNDGRSRNKAYLEELRTAHFFVYKALRWNSHFARYGERITAAQLAGLWKTQRGRCALSGRRLGRDAHLDHITAIARGGGHGIANVRWLDPKVNLARRELSDEEFLALSSDVVRWIGERIAQVEALLAAPEEEVA